MAASTASASQRKRDATPKLSGTKLDPSESFMTGTNATVLEEMYELFKTSPEKVKILVSVDPAERWVWLNCRGFLSCR